MKTNTFWDVLTRTEIVHPNYIDVAEEQPHPIL